LFGFFDELVTGRKFVLEVGPFGGKFSVEKLVPTDSVLGLSKEDIRVGGLDREREGGAFKGGIVRVIC
jgi:hypothetical protein